MYKIYLLRITHGLFALYFAVCLVYLYYSAITYRVDIFLVLAVISLGIEGFVVFVLNKGDCPLIHIQKKISDEKPFFELFFSPPVAKRVLPIFAGFTWLGLLLLLVRIIIELIK